jgi:hypothetical protein
MKTKYAIAAVGCTLVLSACGGGGGGGGGSTSSAAVETAGLSAITAANAPKAASDGYVAGSLISGWSLPVTELLAGVSVTPTGGSVVSPVLDLLRHAYDSKGADLLTGATVSYSCTGGGFLTIDETAVHDHTTISNGDTLTLTATSCTEAGGTSNGKLSIKVSGASGNVFYNATGTLTLDSTFNDFSVATGGTIEIVNGDMKISITNTSSTDATFAISGASLQLTEQRSGATVAAVTLSGYSANTVMQGRTGSTKADFKVSGNANGIGQFAYTVKNLQPFVRTTGSTPSSGSLIVYGASSSVTATVISNGVRVDYSANGNGGVTQSSTLSWSDFSTDF